MILCSLKYAKIAQLVERHLAKVEVAGSNPVFRSKTLLAGVFLCTTPPLEEKRARVVELVDTLDLKSNGHYGRAGSSPASSTDEQKSQSESFGFFMQQNGPSLLERNFVK